MWIKWREIYQPVRYDESDSYPTTNIIVTYENTLRDESQEIDDSNIKEKYFWLMQSCFFGLGYVLMLSRIHVQGLSVPCLWHRVQDRRALTTSSHPRSCYLWQLYPPPVVELSFYEGRSIISTLLLRRQNGGVAYPWHTNFIEPPNDFMTESLAHIKSSIGNIKDAQMARLGGNKTQNMKWGVMQVLGEIKTLLRRTLQS